MLKGKSIGACAVLTFALLIGSGMTTYADTETGNTEEVNTEIQDTDKAAQSEENSSSVVEAGNISRARQAAAKAAKAAAEAAKENQESQPVVEAGASKNKTEAAQAEEAAAADTDEEQAETEEEAAAAQSDTSAQAQTTGLKSLGVFRTTGYCPCHQCSEGWGRHTCTGAIAQANHTIAVDPRVIPYGSRVMINGVIYTAEDKGGGVKGNHIDIFYDTHAQTRQHGSRNQEVFLLS